MAIIIYGRMSCAVSMSMALTGLSKTQSNHQLCSGTSPLRSFFTRKKLALDPIISFPQKVPSTLKVFGRSLFHILREKATNLRLKFSLKLIVLRLTFIDIFFCLNFKLIF